MTYPYRIASAKESEKVHLQYYGTVAKRLFQPVGPFDSFPFDCKMTGNCCKDRALESNHINSFVEVTSIRQFCEYKQVPIKACSRMTLYLDGFEGDRSKIETQKPFPMYKGSVGFGCQFLTADNKCGIHKVKPNLCALSPIGLITDHQGKVFYASLNRQIIEEKCPECTMTDTVHMVKEWIEARMRFTLLDALRAENGFPPLKRDAESSQSEPPRSQ